jgi:hypothetical protein
MSEEGVQLQVWVRTEQAKVYGPLTSTSLELLFDNGIVQGRVQLSLDGQNYVYPGRMPGVRMVVPRELWGDVIAPGEAEDAAYGHVSLPPSIAPPPSAASPGTAPAVGPAPGPPVRPAPTAGPGTRGVPPGRPAPPVNRPTVAHGAVPGSVARSAVSPGAAAPAARGAPPGSARPSGPTAQPATVTTPPQAQPTSSRSAVLTPPAAQPAASGATSVPTHGTLAQHSPVHLYFLAAATDANGLLSLQLSDRVVQIHFKRGNPDFIDSSHANDALPNFLVRAQLATFEQIAQADAEKGRFGGELLGALFGTGVLNPNVAFAQLAQRSASILAHGLLAVDGSFTFELKELPAARAFPLGNKWSALFEQLRRASTVEVRQRLQGYLPLPIMKSGGLVNPSDLKLTPQESRALTFFDGVRSLEQLMSEAPMDLDIMLRTAWMLRECELVAFAGTPSKPAPRPTTSPRGQAPVAPAVTPLEAHPLDQAPAPEIVAPPPPPSAPVMQSGRPVITPAHAKAAVPPAPAAPASAPAPSAVPGNPIGMARPQTVPYPGARPAVPAAAPRAPPVMTPAAPAPVPAPAGPPRISAAAPTTPGLTPSGAQPVLNLDAEVKEAVALAEQMKTQNFFDVLGVTEQADVGAVKAAYFKLARLYHPDTVPPGAPEALARARADIFARIGDAQRTLVDPKAKADYQAELAAGGDGNKVDVSSLFEAEEKFNKGCILVKARKYPEAVKMLDEAIAANAEEPEFYAWRGYAKFFLTTDRAQGADAAKADLDLCLKAKPNFAAQYFFLGTIAKLINDLKTAKVHFARCVQLDKNHIDAQRELRMMK